VPRLVTDDEGLDDLAEGALEDGLRGFDGHRSSLPLLDQMFETLPNTQDGRNPHMWRKTPENKGEQS